MRVYVNSNNITHDDDVKVAGVIGKWIVTTRNRISYSRLFWCPTVWWFQIFPGKVPFSNCSFHFSTCWGITETKINYWQEPLIHSQITPCWVLDNLLLAHYHISLNVTCILVYMPSPTQNYWFKITGVKTHPADGAETLVNSLVPVTGRHILVLGWKGLVAPVEVCRKEVTKGFKVEKRV